MTSEHVTSQYVVLLGLVPFSDYLWSICISDTLLTFPVQVLKITNLSRLVIKPTKWHVCLAKIQISLGIRPVWSESLLSAWRKLGSLATHWAHSEDWSDWAHAQADLSLRWAQSFCWLEAHLEIHNNIWACARQNQQTPVCPAKTRISPGHSPSLIRVHCTQQAQCFFMWTAVFKEVEGAYSFGVVHASVTLLMHAISHRVRKIHI